MVVKGGGGESNGGHVSVKVVSMNVRVRLSGSCRKRVGGAVMINGRGKLRGVEINGSMKRRAMRRKSSDGKI